MPVPSSSPLCAAPSPNTTRRSPPQSPRRPLPPPPPPPHPPPPPASPRPPAPPSPNPPVASPIPHIYSFALRGNTFLMGGHSLDFFDFYRHADNAFVYETSNRDARVWQWDSYLCDVGRIVSQDQHIQFGIYIKPHRGAPIQRTLAAAARGATAAR